MKPASFILVVITMLTALVSVGCGGAGGPSRPAASSAGDRPPSWADSPPRMPGMMHAVGMARGDNRQAAIDNGRAELSAQIQVSVQGERTMLDQFYETADSSGNRSARMTSQVRDQIVTAVDQQDLPGVTVERIERAANSTYALIAFDRSAWAAQLRNRLAEIDAEIARLDQNYAAGDRPLQAASQLARDVLPKIVEREEVARRLRVADPSGTVPPVDFDVAKLMQFIRDLVNQISIRLPDHESMAALNPRLAEAMAGQGVNVVRAGGAAQMALELQLTTSSTQVGNNHRLTGAVRGQLIDLVTGSVIGGIDLSERSASQAMEVAQTHLQNRLATSLATHIEGRIIDMLCR